MALFLFPVRASIGSVKLPDGTVLQTTIAPEFVRALSDLLERVGGSESVDVSSLELAASYQAALVQANDLISQSTIALSAARAEISGLVGRVEALELQLQPVPTGTDWEHPGKIGEATPNSGKFSLVWTATEVRRTAAVATAGYMVNQIDAALKGNGLYWSGANTQIRIADLVVADFASTGLTVTGKFGCNGSTAKAAAALGAAATDPATTMALANNIRTALINNGIGS